MEKVFVDYTCENGRFIKNIYHYDAAYDCRCPYCEHKIHGTIADLDSDGYGIITGQKCPKCQKEFTVELQDCLDETWDDDSSSIPINEAVDIWLSHGMDEDYTCGYSEEALRKQAGLD